MSKTIFITGASSGLGKATALLFANHGWKVIAAMRKPNDEKDLINYDNISLVKLDVTDVEQIQQVVNEAISGGGLDVVFNNAGYGLVGPLEGTSDEQIVDELNTNLLGVIRVTKAFIPFFREQGKGLFISTTSIGGLVTFPFNSVYHATKWALEGWSESMAFELEQFHIGIKTVSPGGIKTDFAGRSLKFAQHEAYAGPIGKVMKAFSDPARADSYSTAQQIAEVVFEAATDGQKQLRYVAGADAKALYSKRLEIGDEAFREQIRSAFLG